MKSEYSKSGVKLRDPKYLAWIRTQTCAAAGYNYITDQFACFGDIVPAHGKPWDRGIKGPDFETIALCFKHHNAEHAGRLKIVSARVREELIEYLNKKYCTEKQITIEELRGK